MFFVLCYYAEGTKEGKILIEYFLINDTLTHYYTEKSVFRSQPTHFYIDMFAYKITKYNYNKIMWGGERLGIFHPVHSLLLQLELLDAIVL